MTYTLNAIFLQLNVVDWLQCGMIFKVYQTMFRVVKDSEHKDERQHCFTIQTCGQESRYMSVETRQELLRIETAWHAAVCSAMSTIGVSSYSAGYAFMARFDQKRLNYFHQVPAESVIFV